MRLEHGEKPAFDTEGDAGRVRDLATDLDVIALAEEAAMLVDRRNCQIGWRDRMILKNWEKCLCRTL